MRIGIPGTGRRCSAMAARLLDQGHAAGLGGRDGVELAAWWLRHAGDA